MTDQSCRLLLCSGGLDSISLLILQRRAGIALKALFIDYGQANRDAEREAARWFCDREGVELLEADMPAAFPPSGLTGQEDDTPYLEGKSRFFLPMRNGVFAALAVSWAMRHGCNEVLLASVRADQANMDSGEPFMGMMDALMRQCSAGRVGLAWPLAQMDKREVMRAVVDAAGPEMAQALMARTWSCYHASASPKVRTFSWGQGCGSCTACQGRRAAAEEMAT